MNGDKSGADIINGSCTACLTHLAVLYEVVARKDPVTEVKMYNLCDSALQRLGAHISKPHYDEHTYLDLLLTVRLSLCCFLTVTTQKGDGQESWNKSLAVFDVRIASLPSEHSGSLRQIRKFIGEMYSDFQARLPDCEPPTIHCLALSEDGVTEDSKYPSLMSAEVRTSYGI